MCVKEEKKVSTCALGGVCAGHMCAGGHFPLGCFRKNVNTEHEQSKKHILRPATSVRFRIQSDEMQNMIRTVRVLVRIPKNDGCKKRRTRTGWCFARK